MSRDKSVPIPLTQPPRAKCNHGWCLLCSTIVVACSALACEPQTVAADADQAQVVSARSADGVYPKDGYGLPSEQRLADGLVVGGQPNEAALARAKTGGAKLVISLRRPQEPHQDEEPEWVEGLGMRFVSLPVAGASGVTEQAARELDAAMMSAPAANTVVHCAAGNRAGALLALRAFFVQGKPSSEALALGTSAGLATLTEHVRGVMKKACTASDPSVTAAQCEE